MKITKVTYYKLHILGRRGNLSKKCEEVAGMALLSGAKVGSCTCTNFCPMFLKRIGNFIICKGKRK
jgi:hypothetical protein